MKYITDKSIDLNETDFLDSITYSEILKQIIKDSPSDKSFTIGLFGEWGSGKSSIIETTRNGFEKEDIKFITYDSWKYSNDSFRRTFLTQISNELCFFEETEEINAELYTDSSKSDIKIEDIPTAVVDGICSKLFYNEKIFDKREIIQQLHYFSPEQFESKFKKIIETYQVRNNACKIVIIIDNIDRCSAEDAYELLSDIKGFLDIKNIIFLIPVDDSALSKQINKYGDNPSEFLRKIFDAVLYVKPLKTTELFDFTKSLNEKNELDFEVDTIYILSEAYATNPRRIIQLVNNLQIELAFFDSYKGLEKKYEIKRRKTGEETSEKVTFSKKYEKVICKLLVIREEWPDFYYEISRRPELLRVRTEPATEWIFPDSNELTIEKERRKKPIEKKLTEFLNNTKSITESENDYLISQLMTVKNPFEIIPNHILNNLSQRKYENEVADYIKESEHTFTLLITHLINELEIEIRKSQIGIRTVGSNPEIAINLDHLLKINELKPIEKIDEKIQNCIERTISNFITDLKELKGLVEYAYELKKRKKTYLYDFIVSMLNVPEHGSSIRGSFYVYLFLIFVNELETSCCKEIQSGFTKKYEEILGLEYVFDSENKKIELEKLPDLISDELIEKLIKNISNEAIQKNLVYIASIDKINKSHSLQISKKIEQLCKSPESKGSYTSEDQREYQQKLKKYNDFIKRLNEKSGEKWTIRNI